MDMIKKIQNLIFPLTQICSIHYFLSMGLEVMVHVIPEEILKKKVFVKITDFCVRVIPCQIKHESPLTSQIVNDWDPWETARNENIFALGLLISETHANKLWAN